MMYQESRRIAFRVSLSHAAWMPSIPKVNYIILDFWLHHLFFSYYPAYNQGFMEAFESARCIQPPVEQDRHSKRRRIDFTPEDCWID